MSNISLAYAAAMEKVPVIGSLIKLVTIRKYIYQEGKYNVGTKVREIENEAAGDISKEISKLTEILIREFYDDPDLNGKRGYGFFQVDYETVMDTPQWITLRLCVSQFQSGTNNYFKYYQIDKINGRIVKRGDLFMRSTYTRLIEEKICFQVETQMQKDSSPVYWTAKNRQGNQNFSPGKKRKSVHSF